MADQGSVTRNHEASKPQSHEGRASSDAELTPLTLVRRVDGLGRGCAGRAAGKRQQGDIARALDGDAEPALMTRADAGHAAGQNLAALLHELRKNIGALVVDEVHLLDAELADFFLAEILALAARTRAGTTGACGGAFATRTSRAASMSTGGTGSGVAAALGVTCRSALAPLLLLSRRPRGRRWRLLLFLGHAFLPFVSFSNRGRAAIESPEWTSTGGLLLGCRSRRAARAARGTAFAALAEFLLPLDVLIEPHGLILNDGILHAETPLELGDEFAVSRANLLIEVDSFAMLGDAIGEFARAPILRLFDLGVLFRASVLDGRKHTLDLVFRRGRASDKDQVVQTLFHDGLVSFLLLPKLPGRR